jgi:hypothetical protein
MAVKIDKKITAYKLVSDEDKAQAAELKQAKENTKIVQLGEPLDRPEKITGSTYKVKTPVTEHALYITINTAARSRFLSTAKTWITFSGLLPLHA